MIHVFYFTLHKFKRRQGLFVSTILTRFQCNKFSYVTQFIYELRAFNIHKPRLPIVFTKIRCSIKFEHLSRFALNLITNIPKRYNVRV